MPFFVYILQNESGAFYIGQTNNLLDRLRRHNENRGKATRTKGPWSVVYQEIFLTRTEAVKREREIKARKSREYIYRLVRTARANTGSAPLSILRVSPCPTL